MLNSHRGKGFRDNGKGGCVGVVMDRRGLELSIIDEGGEGFCPLTNAVVEGVRDGLVR